MRFRKKPVVIDAIQFKGMSIPDQTDLLLFFTDDENDNKVSCGNDQIFIKTLEGTMTANVGDWIVRGIKGELYPCRNDIFEATYEQVSTE